MKLAQHEPWLTKRELALELRCSTRTIERLRMPAMRVGGQNRYRLSEVEAYLSRQEPSCAPGSIPGQTEGLCSMSVFKRGDGWVAKFQLRGEQHWVPGGPWATKSAAREAERRYRERLEAAEPRRRARGLPSAGWKSGRARATSTQRQYRDAMKRFAEHFGPTPLGEVERLSARTWALGVPRNISRIARTMYEDARNVGLVEHNPFSNLRLPTAERTEQMRPPTLDEYREILNACTVLGGYGGEFRAMVQFAAWTGVRAGELQALRWEDIGAGTIWIRRARKRDGTEKKPKNGCEREIAFLPPARVLDELPRRADPYVFHSPRASRSSRDPTTMPGARCGQARGCGASAGTTGGISAPPSC